MEEVCAGLEGGNKLTALQRFNKAHATSFTADGVSNDTVDSK